MHDSRPPTSKNENVRINANFGNTDIYKDPIKFRNLMQSTLKATRPDGNHKMLLKYFSKDAMKIIKEILNNIWTRISLLSGEH